MIHPCKKDRLAKPAIYRAVASLTYNRIFTKDEMKLVRLGLLPVEMETNGLSITKMINCIFTELDRQ
jgi:hypothetical protein